MKKKRFNRILKYSSKNYMKKYMHIMNMGIKDFFQEHIDLKEFAVYCF